MRLRKITFINHPVFKNLDLDFTDSDGNIVDTVIIAGENGVGKSLLLNTIYEFSNFSFQNLKQNEKRIFEVQLFQNEIDYLAHSDNFPGYFLHKYQDNILTFTINSNLEGTWEKINISCKTFEGKVENIPAYVMNENKNKKVLKSIFSDAEINFLPKPIQSVTSSSIDLENIESERSNSELSTQIKQLLIDIQNLDAMEFTEWAKNNTGKPIEPDKIDVRLKRFTTVFDFMFPSKKYKRTTNVNNQIQILFEEDGKEMTINQLSSGEKQIVFRGSFLLKNKESSKGILVLIDEPELSLHPNWQFKILAFFKKLFTDFNGHQTSQLFISTHSPFIIHNVNRINDKVIILQKDSKGLITTPDHPKFYGWSNEKVVQEAFNISHVIESNKTIVYLEGKTDERYFNKSIEVFNKANLPIEFKWIGRINEQGNAEFTGDTALNHARTFFCAHMEKAGNKTILFYDNDTNKSDETIKHLLVRKMYSNKENKIFKVGVENLLTLISDLNISDFYDSKERIDDYGAKSVQTQLNKIRLCAFICESLDFSLQQIVLQNVNTEIERLLAE